MLRKLSSPITSLPQVYAADVCLTTEELIRRHGRLVALYTAAGWMVRDRRGQLLPAEPGHAAMYDSLAEWRP